MLVKSLGGINMGVIKAKQTFTMRNGEIRIPWRSTTEVPDEEIINFIENDSVYSKNEKWKLVFDILSFSEPENERKYFGKVAVGNSFSVVSSDENQELDVRPITDNGRMDSRAVAYRDRVTKIKNEFLILNDRQRNDELAYLADNNDIETLFVIKNLLSSKGDRRWASEVESILNAIEIKKANVAASTAVDEINSFKNT